MLQADLATPPESAALGSSAGSRHTGLMHQRRKLPCCMSVARSLPTLATLIKSISEHCFSAPGGFDGKHMPLPYHSALHLHYAKTCIAPRP